MRDDDIHLVELPKLMPQRDAWRNGDFEAAQGGCGIADNGRPLYSLVKEWFVEPFMALPDDEGAAAHEDLLMVQRPTAP